MNFSNTLFTVEVDGSPRVVFAARFQRDAEAICLDWWQVSNADAPPGGAPPSVDAEPRLKLRLARGNERETYYRSAVKSQDGAVPILSLAGETQF